MTAALRQSCSTGVKPGLGYIRLELDFLPPTVNSAYTQIGRRRIKSRAVKEFCQRFAAHVMARRERALPAGKPYELRIWINVDRKGDISNRIKVLEDALVASGLVPDDRWADRVVIERDRSITGTVIEAWGIGA